MISASKLKTCKLAAYNTIKSTYFRYNLRLKKAISYLLLFLFVTSFLFSQTKKRHYKQREIGVLLGASYYIGDINPVFHFKGSKPAVGAFFRYSSNYRYAFRLGFNYGSLYGSDAKSTSPDQLLRNCNFRTKLYEANAIAEFHFVEYRLGNDKHYFTMYIFGGLAGFHFKPEGDIGFGWQSLQPMRTEGQSKPYSLLQFSIPFGLGFKYNLGDVVGIGIEWGPRKTFTDYIDDVSGLYPDPLINPPSGSGMLYSYRSRERVDLIGTMRGNPRTKDWYFYYGLTINFKLPDAKEHCYGVGGKKYN